jgi:hypothetical protein
MTKRPASTSNDVAHRATTESHTKRVRRPTTDADVDMKDMNMEDDGPGRGVNWGEWMGSHRTGDDVDHESERIDRQKAAFGHDTIARLKDINVLIIGCAGVGVETAKNLILSNVGGVVLWDDTICEEVHRGTNFYVTPGHVERGDVTLADASLSELRSLVSWYPGREVGVLSSFLCPAFFPGGGGARKTNTWSD